MFPFRQTAEVRVISWDTLRPEAGTSLPKPPAFEKAFLQARGQLAHDFASLRCNIVQLVRIFPNVVELEAG